MNAPIELPSYQSPPVVEVALAVHFEPLTQLNIPQLGLLWSAYNGRFPHVEQHAPVESIIERIGVHSPPRQRFSLQNLEDAPLPRLWFVSDSGSELVQIQADFFGRNWRKIKGQVYPRYEEAIRPNFIDDWRLFEEHVARADLGEISPNQCSITYVNHIVSGEQWKTHRQMGEVFRIWNDVKVDYSCIEYEDGKFALRFLLRDECNEFIGRLHVAAEPAFLKDDDKPIFVFTLTCRGVPLQEGIDGIMSFMDLGRRHIVKMFDSITTQAMHEFWGKE